MQTVPPPIPTVAAAQGDLREIDKQRVEVAETLKDIQARIRALALRAALRDPGAQIDMESARQQERAAEERLADLAVARDAAIEKVREAERRAADITQAKRLAAARVLAQRRIAAAERLDKAFAAAEAAFSELCDASVKLHGYSDVTSVASDTMQLGIRFQLAMTQASPLLAHALDVRLSPGVALVETERALWSRVLNAGGRGE